MRLFWTPLKVCSIGCVHSTQINGLFILFSSVCTTTYTHAMTALLLLSCPQMSPEAPSSTISFSCPSRGFQRGTWWHWRPGYQHTWTGMGVQVCAPCLYSKELWGTESLIYNFEQNTLYIVHAYQNKQLSSYTNFITMLLGFLKVHTGSSISSSEGEKSWCQQCMCTHTLHNLYHEFHHPQGWSITPSVPDLFAAVDGLHSLLHKFT